MAAGQAESETVAAVAWAVAVAMVVAAAAEAMMAVEAMGAVANWVEAVAMAEVENAKAAEAEVGVEEVAMVADKLPDLLHGSIDLKTEATSARQKEHT